MAVRCGVATGARLMCDAVSRRVQFGHRLKTRREIELRLGYPGARGGAAV